MSELNQLIQAINKAAKKLADKTPACPPIILDWDSGEPCEDDCVECWKSWLMDESSI